MSHTKLRARLVALRDAARHARKTCPAGDRKWLAGEEAGLMAAIEALDALRWESFAGQDFETVLPY